LEISQIAKKFKAAVPFLRSKKNSRDTSTLVEVLLEVIGEYKKIGRFFDYVCCILPAAPLIRPERIKGGLHILKKKNADALMPVVQFSHPIQRAFEIKNSRLKMICPKNAQKNSQDLAKAYHDCGQFYWLKVESLVRQKKIFVTNLVPMEIAESETQDIDTEEDLKIAALKYRLLSDRNK